MGLKEKIKEEIDLLSEKKLYQLEQYLKILKTKKQKIKHIKTIHLKGKFDNIDIRKLAYE